MTLLSPIILLHGFRDPETTAPTDVWVVVGAIEIIGAEAYVDDGRLKIRSALYMANGRVVNVRESPERVLELMTEALENDERVKT